MARVKWTQDRILLEIRRRHARGEKLTARALQAVGLGGMVATAYKLFGSWRAAIEAAGVPPPEPRSRLWTTERIIATIRSLQSRGADLSHAAMSRTDSALVNAAYRHPQFGNWRAALEAAGVLLAEHEQRTPRTRQSIIEEIQAVAAQGEPLSFGEARKRHPKLVSAACAPHQFGSWAKAVSAAGFDYDDCRLRRKWTRERILATIKRLHAQGQPLTTAWMKREGWGALVGAASRPGMFGSWREAVECAGIDYESVRKAGLEATRNAAGGERDAQ